MKPLQGIRILDLTQILSGPYATQILADLGAEVIKIEQPGGDKSRHNGPFVNGYSTYFASVNRGKKSLVLNLKNAAGLRVFFDLVQQATVVVENFRPTVAERLGIGFSALCQVNPQVIYAACSGFGHTGPSADRPALDIIIQALAGTMSVTGEPDQGPMRVGFSIGDLGAGLYLTVAVLAALYQNLQQPQPIFIDLSMLDSQVALLENAYARFFATGDIPQPTGSRHPVIAPFQCFQAADHLIVVAASTDAQWTALINALGAPELSSDPRFQTQLGRGQHNEALASALQGIFRSRSADQWVSRLERAGVPVGRVNNIAEAAQDPQIVARRMFSKVQFGSSSVQVVASPLRFNGEPLQGDLRVAELNEHQSAVLRDVLGYDAALIQRLANEGAFGWQTEPQPLN